MNNITFTKYQSNESVSKRYWLENNNNKYSIQKQAAAQMYQGTAERVTLPFKDFAEAMALADEKTAFGYGLHSQQYPDKVKIAVNGKEQSDKNIISRTQKFYKYGGEGLSMIDQDPSEYGQAMNSDELVTALIEIHPAIGGAARIIRGSVSAGVHLAGEQPRTDKGFHIYMPVINAADIPRYGAVLFNRLWLAGLGFIALDSNGALLERAPIDGAVFSPERLDFVGKPIISGAGLEFTPPEITYIEGTLLDTESLQSLTDDELQTVKSLKADAKAAIKPKATLKQKQWADAKIETMRECGVPIEKAREVINQILNGGCHDLYDDFILEFITGLVSVADVLKDGKAFDGKALADPIEGRDYGQTTAKFYWNNGKPVINSLAHGQETKYFLHTKHFEYAKNTAQEPPHWEEEPPFYGKARTDNPVNYEPEPLRAPIPKAEPFPVEALGDVLGAAAKALHETIKAPLTLCCQGVLASSSLAAQSHYDVKLPWGEKKPLSLFLLTVAESGERKSGVDDVVLGAAKAQERQDMEGYAIEHKLYESELAQWKEVSDAANKAAAKAKNQTANDYAAEAKNSCPDKPEAPIMPLRFVTEPTVEGLYKLLAVGQPSVGLFSDEAGLLIGGHALNSDNALKTMARLCKFWDGAAFDRVRAGDGSGILYGR